MTDKPRRVDLQPPFDHEESRVPGEEAVWRCESCGTISAESLSPSICARCKENMVRISKEGGEVEAYK